MIHKCLESIPPDDLLLQKLMNEAHSQAHISMKFFLCFIGLIILAVVIGYFEDKKRRNGRK